jgi:hypothetical protein
MACKGKNATEIAGLIDMPQSQVEIFLRGI